MSPIRLMSLDGRGGHSHGDVVDLVADSGSVVLIVEPVPKHFDGAAGNMLTASQQLHREELGLNLFAFAELLTESA